MRARQEMVERGRRARDKKKERTCLTLLIVHQKAMFFAAEKILQHSPFLPLAVWPRQPVVAAALTSSLLS